MSDVIITHPQSEAYRQGFERAWPTAKPHDAEALEHRVVEVFSGFERCSCGALTKLARVRNTKGRK